MCGNEGDLGGPLLCRLVLVLSLVPGARVRDPQRNGPLVPHIGYTESAFGELHVVYGIGLAGEHHYCGHTDIARRHELVRVVLLPAPEGRECGG